MASSADETHEEVANNRRFYATSCDEQDEDPGEQRVEDVTIKFFYQPRTLTLLSVLILLMIYFAFQRDPEVNQHDNFWHGAVGVIGSFLVITLLICPNGPFVRPHPAIWRLVLGFSIVYALGLVFALFQNYKDIKTILNYIDPKLTIAKPDSMEDYSEDCSWSAVWTRIDIFVVAHFLGWAMKALMLRHAVLLWVLSIVWEVTEIAFAHLLENFKECWWDQLVLDVLLCNGLGIHFGLFICRMLEMRTYHWESIKDIQGTSKKLRRAVLQFTPVSWMEVRWFDPKCVKMRILGMFGLVIIWQISELNTFFLKHIFVVPTGHWINIIRVIFIGLIAVPAIRQFYLYITDVRCKRVGTQCWMFICITFLEFMLCVSHARELFSRTEVSSVAWWLFFITATCLAVVYLVAKYGEKVANGNHIKNTGTRSETRVSYDENEYEGDTETTYSAPKRRKYLKRAAKEKTK